MLGIDTLELLPEDPILGLHAAYKKDLRTEKLNLSIGVLLNPEGETQVFPSIQDSFTHLSKSPLKTSYLPIEGDPFISSLLSFVLGNNAEKYLPSLSYTQSAGGTHALFLALNFLKKLGYREIYIPNPTWPNHPQIISEVGLKINTFPYLDKENLELDYKEWKNVLENTSNTLILFHVVCQNPTGIDPDKNLWKELLELCKKQGHFCLFDMAYQGLGNGWEEDVFPLHYALEIGLQHATAVSFSKNCSLYGERLGLLYFYTHDKQEKILSHLRFFQRTSISNPPRFPTDLLKKLFEDSALCSLWQKELEEARKNLIRVRHALFEALPKKERFFFFKKFLEKGRGLFAPTFLSHQEILFLREKKGIYLPSSGRISLSGLSEKGISYFSSALQELPDKN